MDKNSKMTKLPPIEEKVKLRRKILRLEKEKEEIEQTLTDFNQMFEEFETKYLNFINSPPITKYNNEYCIYIVKQFSPTMISTKGIVEKLGDKINNFLQQEGWINYSVTTYNDNSCWAVNAMFKIANE